MKSFKALEKLKKDHYIDGRLPLIDKLRFELIENELKALKIIKNKNVNCAYVLKYKSVNSYNLFLVKERTLTKEEWKLLKEVLK